MSRIIRGPQARARLSDTFLIQPSRLRWQLAHAAMLGMLASAAIAAEHDTHHHHAEHQSVQLEPMVITGVAQQSPLTVTTDPKIPRQPVPASDAGDYLKTIPGFSAVRNGGVNGDPVFRGMFGSRLKLLSNGGEMLGACPNRMDSPSSYISPDTYDRLTVIKGPQSVLWGAGASAATILFERGPEQFSEPDYRIDASMLTRASKLVAAATSFPVQYNKAIVGRNAFAHESGIHQDGMLKHTQTYEIMTPESVGVSKTSLVMGKHSGRNAFRTKLKDLGYDLGENALEDAFNRFKALADRKKIIYDEDIEALVDEEIATATDRIKVVALTVIAGTSGPQSATLTLDVDGKQTTIQSAGNGPVDATFNAIQKIVPHTATLELYQVHAVTEGTDAQAEVSVRLQEEGRTVTAKAADPDTLVASAKAYIGALNKLMIKRQRGAPAQHFSEPAAKLKGV